MNAITPPTTCCLMLLAASCICLAEDGTAGRNLPDQDDSWPTYMRDAARSGVSPVSLPWPLSLHWRRDLPYRPAPAWPPPARQNFWRNQTDLPARVTFDRSPQTVCDGRRLLLGSSADGRLRCFDLRTGDEQWSFATEGPLRLAPALHDGRAYVGSDDGHVYCLQIADGRLLWKFRCGPEDRRVPGNGRMISVWPVRTGVIVESGRARFAAGLFPTQGVRQYALDARSGKLLAEGELNFSPQGYMQLDGKALRVAQGRAPAAVVTMLDRIEQTESPAAARAIAQDLPYAWVAAGEVSIGGGDGRVAAFAEGGRPLWSAAVEGRAHGLTVAGGRLIVTTDEGKMYCFGGGDAAPDRPTIHRPDVAADDDATARSSPASAAAASLAEIVRPGLPAAAWCLLLGEHTEGLIGELARGERLEIVARHRLDAEVQAARREIAAARLGLRAAVHRGEADRLPYGSGLFNVVLALPADGRLTEKLVAEAARAVRPAGGVALIRLDPALDREAAVAGIARAEQYDVQELQHGGRRWLRLTRRPLPGAGQWTHLYASPANTACSEDPYIGAPLRLQWFGAPGPRDMLDRHHRTVAPLYASGRLFVPGNNRVYGVDAYNGAVLWETEVPGSRRVAIASDCGSMAAAADRLYVAAGEHCVCLDAASGELRERIRVAADGGAEQRRHWGYVAVVGGRLLGTATRPGASRSGHSRKQIDQAYYDAVPLVTSHSLFSRDRHSGDSHWQYRPRSGAIVNATITVADDTCFFVESRNPATLEDPSGRAKLAALVGSEHGADLVAVRMGDGSEAWRRRVPLESLEHHLFACFARGRLVLVGTKNRRAGGRAVVWYDTHCFDAADGKPLWSATQNQGQGAGGSHGEQDHHPAIVGGTVYVEPAAYDLETGAKREGWSLSRGGHGCGSLSASGKMCFFRAGNPTMCDLATGVKTKVTRVSRPGCWINVIPAGGLVLIPEASSGCVCNFPIQSSLAFASAALGE